MEIRDTKIFLDYFNQIHRQTVRVVRCIPPDKVDWSFRSGRFTLGDLARHIAAANRYLFAEVAQGKPSSYSGCGRHLAPGLDEILAFSETLHQQSVDIVSQLRDLNAKCVTPEGAAISTWKWVRAMVEHEAHHRGQIYIYLAMLEVPTPPLYGLTSEQVIERSTRI